MSESINKYFDLILVVNSWRWGEEILKMTNNPEFLPAEHEHHFDLVDEVLRNYEMMMVEDCVWVRNETVVDKNFMYQYEGEIHCSDCVEDEVLFEWLYEGSCELVQLEKDPNKQCFSCGIIIGEQP